MEFESDDDVAEHPKNTNNAKTEGTVHYYEFCSEEEEGEHADPKKSRKPKMDMRIQVKMMKMIRLLSPMK